MKRSNYYGMMEINLGKYPCFQFKLKLSFEQQYEQMSAIHNHGTCIIPTSANNLKPKSKQQHGNDLWLEAQSQNRRKKQVSKGHNIKRPQTPNPVPTEHIQPEKITYPKPELILKEIQKNVNMLKEMYYASLSHQSIQQNHSHNETQQSHINNEADKDTNRVNRKSFDGLGRGKKLIPEIQFAPPSQFRHRKFNTKVFHEIGKNNENRQSKEKGSKEKKPSKERKQHLNQKKKSNSHLEKNNVPRSEKEPQSGTQNTNINSLFEIFKFYKKSIDSSLSKRNSTANLKSNNGGSYALTKNPHQKSYGKETPNNSTAKNTTNNKNSTMSRMYGSSIEISVEEDGRNYESRKNSASHSTKKKKCDEAKQSKEKVVQSKSKTRKKTQQKHITKKQLVTLQTKKKKSAILNQKVKEPLMKKESKPKTKIDPFFKTQKIQKPLKQFDKKSLASVHQEAQPTKKNEQHFQNTQKIQFPEIQSSLFDKNMPILEQYSMEDASSELIAMTSQKQQPPSNSPANLEIKQLFKKPDDSLVGCSIAKIETDSDLDNYELVSFEF